MYLCFSVSCWPHLGQLWSGVRPYLKSLSLEYNSPCISLSIMSLCLVQASLEILLPQLIASLWVSVGPILKLHSGARLLRLVLKSLLLSLAISTILPPAKYHPWLTFTWGRFRRMQKLAASNRFLSMKRSILLSLESVRSPIFWRPRVLNVRKARLWSPKLL